MNLVDQFSHRMYGSYGMREYLIGNSHIIRRAIQDMHFEFFPDEIVMARKIINTPDRYLLGHYLIENSDMDNVDKVSYVIDYVLSGSVIILITGGRGSGKTCFGGWLFDKVYHKAIELGIDLKFYWLGASAQAPDWIEPIISIDEIQNDSIVLVDEAMITHDSRRAISKENVKTSHLLAVARQKNLRVLFISQLMSGVDKRIFQLSDAIIQKKAPTFLIDSEERGAKMFKEYMEFMMPKRQEETLFFDGTKLFRCLTGKPDWWTEDISCVFRDVDVTKI